MRNLREIRAYYPKKMATVLDLTQALLLFLEKEGFLDRKSQFVRVNVHQNMIKRREIVLFCGCLRN